MTTYNVIGMSREIISSHRTAAAAFAAIEKEKNRFEKSGRSGYLPRTVVCGNNYSYHAYTTSAHGADVVEKVVVEYDDLRDEYFTAGYTDGAGNKHK